MRQCSTDIKAKPGSPCLTDNDAHKNFVGCTDTSRSPVVHQWDRHAGILGRFIESNLACKQNCMKTGMQALLAAPATEEQL